MPEDARVPTASFVYHRVPPNLRGSVLYPLNQLPDFYPDLYAERRKSYATRKDIAALRIPPLGGCLWNDVLHFTAVHPRRIKTALEEAGHNLPHGWNTFFEIDASLLDPAATVIYECRTIFWSGQFDVSEASIQLGRECLPYSPEALERFGEVTQIAREHYASVAPGGDILLFLGIPHILHRAMLDLDQSGVQIIEV